MAVSMEEVRHALDPEEPDYAAVAHWDDDALPHLRALAAGDDPMLASKAVYAASLLAGDTGAGIVQEGARASDDIVRVAAAAAVRNLPADAASDVLDALDASDAGIRRVARASAPEGVSTAFPEPPAEPDAGGSGGADTTKVGPLGGLMPGEEPNHALMAGEASGLMPGETSAQRPGDGEMPR